MDTLKTLESNVTKWQGEIETRKKKISSLNYELAVLLHEAIDSTGAKADNARMKRAEALTMLEALNCELQELQARHETAVAAVKASKVAAAQKISEAAHIEAATKRAAIDAAYNKLLRFVNSRGKETDKTVETKEKIDFEIAKAKAEAKLAARRDAELGAAVSQLRGA